MRQFPMACGVDLVDIERLGKILARRPAFLNQYFGPRERTAFGGRTPSLAMALAAKEAFLKATGEGILGRVPLRQVQLSSTGADAELLLGRDASALLSSGGHVRTKVTVSADEHHAMAWVVLISGTTPHPNGYG